MPVLHRLSRLILPDRRARTPRPATEWPKAVASGVVRGAVIGLLWAGPVAGQVAQAESAPATDICALNTRLGSARAAGGGVECQRRRTSLLPGLATAGTDSAGAATTDWLIAPLPFEFASTFRSGYPLDRGNGALWSGRGIGFALTGGATTTFSRATIALAPVLTFTQNRTFPLPDQVLPGQPRGAYPWAPAGLDWPLRRGAGPRWDLFLGDSYVDVPFTAVTTTASAGISSERLWWGPARRFPLLFGANGPGFVHAYVRTTSPVRTYAGDFTGELLWGRATESDWFDGRVSNDHRLLGAFQIGWSYEDYLPGLELSMSVVRHDPLDGGGLGLTRLPRLFLGDAADGDPADAGLSWEPSPSDGPFRTREPRFTARSGGVTAL